MTDVLISAGELTELLKKEPCVVIDTRNPDAYSAGHLPNAVNVHEIFTYLATSTPDGMHELKTKFADAFGGAGLSGTGPKAGGPNYLGRFALEQTASVNTAAVGGNASLLAEQS